MSGPAHNNKNLRVHRTVVDLVGLFLDSDGIGSTAKRTPTRAKISDALADDVLAPDLALDRGIDLRVSSRLRPFRLAEDLEQAQRVAALRGSRIGGLIQWRSETPIEQVDAIVSLADFAKLVRGDHLTPP